MTETAIRELNAIRLSVNNELGDQIVAAWLKQHLSWAQDAYNGAIHADDKADAASDLICMSRVYRQPPNRNTCCCRGGSRVDFRW